MQQTTSRKLSIIESSDPFLPEALNDNTRKIEAALDSHETRTQAVTDALDQRVTVLEGRKMAWGVYTGDGVEGRIVPLPFTPKAVIIHDYGYNKLASMAVEGQESIYVKVKPGGFQVVPVTNTNDSSNRKGTKYLYAAFC